MSKTISFVALFKHRIYMKLNLTKQWLTQHWFKITLLGVVVLLLQQKDLNLQFNLSAQPPATESSNEVVTHQKVATAIAPVKQETSEGWLSKLSVSNLASRLTSSLIEKVEIDQTQAETDNLSNTYSNMTYNETSRVVPTRSAAELAKLKKQNDYVDRFVSVAQSEMRKYRIPASIKLAQGLIETNAGASRLSKKNNNHFGMKCFSKKCKKGHCSNFTDDSHKDFFRKYKSAWASYRSHSEMLTSNARYRKLFKLAPTDYRNWAHGLYKAGYATDKRYAEKLISVIEELGLQQYDL